MSHGAQMVQRMGWRGKSQRKNKGWQVLLILVMLRNGLLGWGSPATPAKTRSPEFRTWLDIGEAPQFLEESTEHGS